jgi:biopolymer transport protein ExbD/biopolymer transport protein TolR
VSITNKMLRRRTKPIQPIAGMNLTAFTFAGLGVALTLLVAFMCAPTAHHGVSIDPPRVNHPKPLWHAKREDALVVAVLRDGKVFFGNNLLAPHTLGETIREHLSLTREKKIYNRVDGRNRWGNVAPVIDQVREAGVQDVSFFAEQRNPAAVSQ